MKEARRSSLAFILITILIDGIGAGIMMPVFPRLLVELTGKSLASAAAYGGLLLTIFAAIQLLAAPVLGNLSDRYGRRPILLGSLAALGINYFVVGFAPHVSWIFIGQILAGVFAATYSTASAYIADISAPAERAKHFGMLSAAFSAGFVIGPMLGGLLAEHNLRLPFFVGAALALLNVLYGYFMLPESLPQDQRRPFSLMRANPLGTLNEVRKQPVVLRMLGVLALFQAALLTVVVIWPYLTLFKFGWTQRDVGLSLSLYVCVSLAAQSWLTHVVSRRIGQPKTMYLGLALLAIGMTGFAFAPSSGIMLAFLLPAGLGSLTLPALTSYLVGRTSRDAQGELQGAIAIMLNVAALSSPLIMTQLFRSFSVQGAAVYLPGAPFLLAAVFALAGLLWTWLTLQQDDTRAALDFMP
jgi:DHA1 family tetracycline resistance protein-like MFS transporter